VTGNGKRVDGSDDLAPRRDPHPDPDYDPHYDPEAPVVCEICGAEMYYTASCKLRCPRCGYTRDCTDP
jgi:hypothetical protein